MIIGITGTDGSGKGAVVEYIVKKKGFVHYSSRSFILEHIQAKSLPVTRSQMRLTANELRKEHGNAFVVQQAYEKAIKNNEKNIIIESIRAVAEGEYLKDKGGLLISVDADQRFRYSRVQKRRSESDKVTFSEFVKHEELEKNDPDPHGMQKAKVMNMADFTILNEGSFNDLHIKIDTILRNTQKNQSL